MVFARLEREKYRNFVEETEWNFKIDFALLRNRARMN